MFILRFIEEGWNKKKSNKQGASKHPKQRQQFTRERDQKTQAVLDIYEEMHDT